MTKWTFEKILLHKELLQKINLDVFRRLTFNQALVF